LFERTRAAVERTAALPGGRPAWKPSRNTLATKARHVLVAAAVACLGITRACAADAPAGAASCTGCHAEKPNVNTPVPRLAGHDAGAMIAAMQAYRSGLRPATVMDRIAKGFSDDEMQAIAAWFAALR
jgi:cytochrome subunit of sulfide dehydrogenase